jgi:hypothetical protein
MRNVYEVKYEAQTQSEHEGNHRKIGRPGWSPGEVVHIEANGTVRGALEKAEKFLLSRVESFTDEYGAPLIQRTLKVRVTSCERVLTLDA